MQALDGIKVLELGQLIAGPFAGKTLAEFGADVIKIEPPGEGDPLRKWRLLRNGTSRLVAGAVAQQAVRVRSTCADAEGQDIVRALVARSRHRDREFPARHARRLGARLGAARMR